MPASADRDRALRTSEEVHERSLGEEPEAELTARDLRAAGAGADRDVVPVGVALSLSPVAPANDLGIPGEVDHLEPWRR